MKGSGLTDEEVAEVIAEVRSSLYTTAPDVCKCHGVPRVNKGDHMSCRVKHREQNLKAVRKYQKTAKGMLSRVSADAKQRGNR